MAIITISRGSFSRGKEVAEKLAKKLGYECVSREILLEASNKFNIPEIDFTSALHNSPSIMERFGHGKIKYMSYYTYALLNHVKHDNVVYHGLAGQYFLREIPHVFKVRIIANIEDRVHEVMKRDGISKPKALELIKQDDKERRKWSLQLYGINTMDSRLYDMVININKIQVDDAVDILYNTAKNPDFQSSPASQKKIEELTLAAKIRSQLIDYSLLVEVKVKEETAYLAHIGEVLKHDNELRGKIEKMITEIEGIKRVEFLDSTSSSPDHVNPFYNIGN